jgi:hypothetical protein
MPSPDDYPISFTRVATDALSHWVIPGHNEDVKARLRDDWPQLWHAMEALAQYDGITPYTPEPVPLTGPEKARLHGESIGYHPHPDDALFPQESGREWAIVQTTGEIRQYYTEGDARRAMKTERGRILLSRMPGTEWKGTK